MRSWLESEWQRLGGGALVFLPLALVFRALVAARRFLYRARILPAWRARVPVIVVGNISVGGTGKTPLVLEILEILARRGWTPGVVARGYGRVPRGEQDPLGVVRVYPGVATPEHFGDEPVVIARRSRVPVYISPDRPAAARALLEAHPEVNVLVSDDGLQHYALARDVELAVVDGERPRSFRAGGATARPRRRNSQCTSGASASCRWPATRSFRRRNSRSPRAATRSPRSRGSAIPGASSTTLRGSACARMATRFPTITPTSARS